MGLQKENFMLLMFFTNSHQILKILKSQQSKGLYMPKILVLPWALHDLKRALNNPPPPKKILLGWKGKNL